MGLSVATFKENRLHLLVCLAIRRMFKNEHIVCIGAHSFMLTLSMIYI